MNGEAVGKGKFRYLNNSGLWSIKQSPLCGLWFCNQTVNNNQRTEKETLGLDFFFFLLIRISSGCSRSPEPLTAAPTGKIITNGM